MMPGERAKRGAVPIPFKPKLNVPPELATCNGTGREPAYPGAKVAVTLQTVPAASAVLRAQSGAVTVSSRLFPCDAGAVIPVIVVPAVFTSSATVTAMLVELTGVVGNSTLPVGVLTSRTRLLLWSEM